MKTIFHTVKLTVLTCCKCGGSVGLHAQWVEMAQTVRQHKHQFWCPYCRTTQGWGGLSKEDELKRDLQQLQASNDRLAGKARDALAEAEHFRRSRDGVKGVVAKLKKRVGRGVCPCCNRHFSNLQRHMESKHPDVAKGHVEDTPATI